MDTSTVQKLAMEKTIKRNQKNRILIMVFVVFGYLSLFPLPLNADEELHCQYFKKSEEFTESLQASSAQVGSLIEKSGEGSTANKNHLIEKYEKEFFTVQNLKLDFVAETESLVDNEIKKLHSYNLRMADDYAAFIRGNIDLLKKTDGFPSDDNPEFIRLAQFITTSYQKHQEAAIQELDRLDMKHLYSCGTNTRGVFLRILPILVVVGIFALWAFLR